MTMEILDKGHIRIGPLDPPVFKIIVLQLGPTYFFLKCSCMQVGPSQALTVAKWGHGPAGPIIPATLAYGHTHMKMNTLYYLYVSTIPGLN